MTIGRRGDGAGSATRPGARLRGSGRGVVRRLAQAPARHWTGAVTASAVAVPLVLVAVLAEGNAVRELAQSSASAWVASPQQGIVSLVDGPSDVVAAALRVPSAASLEVEQAGSSAYVVDDAAGTVARIDGATYDVSAPVAFGTPGGSLSVLQGVDDVYVLDATRRIATVVDPRTLAAVDEVSLGAQPGPGQAVVDDDGRLWVVDAQGGGLTWFDGTHHVDREAADADDRLVLVRGAPVLVDPTGQSVARLDDSGAVGRRSCLELRAGDTAQLLGSTDRDEVYAAIAQTGTLVIAAVGRDDCSRVVPLAAPGTPADFGTLAQSGRFVFVPDHLTGQVVVVDLRDDEVVGRLDLTPAGNRLQLVAKDGVVFYNDLDGNAVGVLRFDGRAWVPGDALSKYDPSDGDPVAVIPDPPSPEQPPAPEAGPAPTAAPDVPDASQGRPTPPADRPAAPPARPGTGGGGRPDPVAPTPSAGPTPVSVQVDVTGPGTVTSTPPGISCPGTCAAPFPPGTQVTLTAAPAGSAAQRAWSGACADVPAGDPCRIDVRGPTTAGAAFEVPPGRVSVVVTVVGAGSVESDPPGLSCVPATSPCTAEFDDDVPVLLTAVAAPGAEGGVWSGDCTDRHCELPAGAGGDVTVTFVTLRLLAVEEPTGGRITGPGIDCPGDCDEWLPQGEVVTLDVTQDEDARFVAWAQDCSGTSTTCELTVDADAAVGATFEAYPIGPFVGTWRDVRSDSNATAVIVATSATSATVEYWADCGAPPATGCYWGTASGTVSGGTLTVDYDNTPATYTHRYVTLSRSGDLLHTEVLLQYTASDGRPDLSFDDDLARSG